MFDKAKIRLLRDAINKELSVLGQKLGVSLQLGNATYRDVTCTFKLNCVLVGESGQTEDIAALEFKRNAKLVGLEESDLDRTFHEGGKLFRVVGFKPSCWKNPVICETGGKRYKFPVDRVKAALNSDYANRRLASAQAPVRAEVVIMADIRQIEDELSPEMLTCDGELSPIAVRQRRNGLERRRKDLQDELDRLKVTSFPWKS